MCIYCGDEHSDERNICYECFCYKDLIKCDACSKGFIANNANNEKVYNGCDICNTKMGNPCCENCFDIFIRVRSFFPISKTYKCLKCSSEICKSYIFKCCCLKTVCRSCTELSFKIYHNGTETCGMCKN